MIKSELKKYHFKDQKIQLCIPNNHDLFFEYKQQHPQQLFPIDELKSKFPYWAKVWHSAIAISRFIVENTHLVKNKKVLEIAAGLGLPSMATSKYATNVICTDYIADALIYVNESIKKNNLLNCTTQLIDWNNIPNELEFDVLLISDVNYEISQFEVLEKMFKALIEKNKTIILATPQRLMAKDFIEKLLPFCIQNKEYEINIEDEKAFVNVLVLQNLL